jgi:DNA-binding IclR family transcriptional regulator
MPNMVITSHSRNLSALEATRCCETHATAGGLVLFAYAAPELQDALLALPLRCYTPRTPTTPEPRLLGQAEHLAQGCALCDQAPAQTMSKRSARRATMPGAAVGTRT